MINPKKMLVKNLVFLFLFAGFGIGCVISGRPTPSYIGFFAGGMAVLLISVIRLFKMMKSEAFKKQYEIAVSDERTKMINAKTSEITTFTLLMTCCAGGFVSMLIGRNDYLYIFGGLVILFVLVHSISKAVLNKKF